MRRDRFVIEGGRRLAGEVTINGAKNAALPILAAALLTAEPCVIDNVPLIEDIRIMAEIMRQLGCQVTFDEPRHRITVCAESLNSQEVPTELGRAMRGSFLLVGPVLARCGMVRAPFPGGDQIGARPVDVHTKGLAAMGTDVRLEGGVYDMRASRLRSDRLYLDYPSHTGTETLIMAASLAKGRTVIKNACAEPEVIALAECLNRMGARIRGAGSSLIEVDGVTELYGIHVRVIPDRIEAGTFALAAAITGGEVLLNRIDVDFMDPLTYKLRETGVRVEVNAEENRYHVDGRHTALKPVEMQTLHYPGFPTDLQSAFTTLLTQANGTSVVFERVYEDRLNYTAELAKLGATIEIRGQTARIHGPTKLRGAVVRALDIRAGASLILAGLVAEGRTEIGDIYHVDKGYEAIDQRLRDLGAAIERVRDEALVAR